MKKLQLAALMLLLFASAFSQDSEGPGTRIFKPFKFEISVGYAHPTGGSGTINARGGALFALEPHYAVADNISLGLRLELAAMARGVVYNNQTFEGEASASASYMLTGDYYFSKNTFRPFAGVGAGFHNLANAIVNSNNDPNLDNIPTETKFGFLVRGGFEAGHFRMGLEYNIVGATDYSKYNNYFSIKVGACIGGGRYK